MTVSQQNTFHYSLHLADTALILGHRLSEWCSKAPTLEIDMAFSNMALDLIGQSRNFYQHAAQTENAGRNEDQLAYLRDAHEFRNLLIAELENDDFAHTVVRQFFFAAFQLPFFEQLAFSNDAILAGAAEKAVKEMSYHLRWSSEWLIRLADGTPESRQRTEKAVQNIWTYCGEMWSPTPLDQWAADNLNAPNIEKIAPKWLQTVKNVFERANLTLPTQNYWQKGGKNGQHTERLGYLLAEMQFLQRAYPNSEW